MIDARLVPMEKGQRSVICRYALLAILFAAGCDPNGCDDYDERSIIGRTSASQPALSVFPNGVVTLDVGVNLIVTARGSGLTGPTLEFATDDPSILSGGTNGANGPVATSSTGIIRKCERAGQAVITVTAKGQAASGVVTLTKTIQVTCKGTVQEPVLIQVSPTSLSFTHVVGTSPCP